MEFLIAASLDGSLIRLLNILYVALGLGLVIFFHELGHFAVAKWCDVHVERFSIGFGPILWSRKKGETEYALSAIPFGGYVKMLGQDDMDPSQLSSEDIAMDPRSYSAKSVPQRMAIISAGVIMNVITGMLFFAGAFGLGVKQAPAVIGHVSIAQPAWQAGIEEGDRITAINGKEISSYSDIVRAVALSSTDTLQVEGVRRNDETYSLEVAPDVSGTRRRIDALPTMSLTIMDREDLEFPVIVPGSAASRAEPPFQPGDTLVSINGTKLDGFAHLQEMFASLRAETLEIKVLRKPKAGGAREEVVVKAPPAEFRTLGLTLEIGPVVAIQNGSPARRGGLEVEDKIIRIDDQEVGGDLDPARLPDYFADRHGQDVKVVVQRRVKGGEPKEVELHLTPRNRPGWLETPTAGSPMSIPAIGVAYHLIPTVLKVEPDSPAAKAGLLVGDRLKKVDFILPTGAEPDGYKDENGAASVELDKKSDGGERIQNGAYAFWMLQAMPTRTVRLHYTRDGKTETAELAPVRSDGWYLPTRGIRPEPLMVEQKASGLVQAVQMGFKDTRNSILEIYLTLRNLFGGRLSVKELHGPIGIAQVAYQFAREGIAPMLLFLGFLSVNLAVLNFLPIPVLDGGHMVFLCWEAVTRRKPSERVLVAATYVGFAFVLGLMMFVLFLDVFVHWKPWG